MSLSRFNIRLNESGLGGRVIVDEEDVSNKIVGFHINAEIGQVPELVLFSTATGEIEGNALVTWDGSEIAKMHNFLDNLDAEELQAKAMGNLSWGEERTIAEMVIEEIKNELRGRAPVRPDADRGPDAEDVPGSVPDSP